MLRFSTAQAWLAALVVWACTPQVVNAQLPLGIPIARGVPGDSKPPDWVAVSPPYSNKIDDPRWVGSAGVSYGAGSSQPMASFQVLKDTDNLYLSWFVRFDPQVVPLGDRIYVGFAHPDANAAAPAVLFSIKLKTETNTVAGRNETAREVLCYQRKLEMGVPTWELVSTPQWATDTTAVWINDPAGRIDVQENNGQFWAVNMKVPVLKNPAAADVPVKGVPSDPQGNMKVWYEIDNVFSGSVHQMAYPANAAMLNPDGLGVNDLGTPDPYLPDPAGRKWAPIHLRQSALDATPCANDGISIVSVDVGVVKKATVGMPLPMTLPTEIGFPPNTSPMTDDVLNMFVARPYNGMASSVQPQQLQARFRIANWGSQIASTGTWAPLPSDNNLPVVNNAPIASGQKGDIRLYWTAKKTDPFVQSFMGMNPARNRHQCILVELTPAGGNLNFVTTSLYQNMNFVEASKFSRVATISVEGLPAVAPGAATRDVFLLVRTNKMPPQAGGPPLPIQPWPTANPMPPGPPSVPAIPKPKGEAPPILKVAAAKDEQPKDKQGAVIDRVPPPPLQAEPPVPPLPSYTVYAWHDTGRTLNMDGLKLKVVEPQTSFGYYVTHEGPLSGWQYSLKGATQIGPDFYKVSPPTNGSVDVVTEIEAVEHGPVNPCCPPQIVVCPPRIVVCPPAQPERRRLLFRRR